MAQQFWITGINPKKFDIEKAFSSLSEIDLHLNVDAKETVQVGDIVYIYLYYQPRGIRDDEFVRFKTIVVETGIEPKDRIDDKEFVTEKGKSENTADEKFTRLKLLQTYPNFLPISCLVVRRWDIKKDKTQILNEDCVDYIKYHDKPTYFPKGCFAYLIDKCSKEKYKSLKSKPSQWKGLAENVRNVLPVLVSWAKTGLTNSSYFALIGVIANTKSKYIPPIDDIMAGIHDVLTELSKETKQGIPTLNFLIKDLFSGLPKHKADNVFKGFDDLSKEDKLKVIDLYNAEAINYKNWEWVLAMLGLDHTADKELIEGTLKGDFGPSDKEKQECKRFKLQLSENPREWLIYSYGKGEIDHVLLSGDTVDVYFPDCNTAVVVLSSTATEEEVLHGIFQCVKFKALLEAEAKYKGDYNNVKVILGVGETLSAQANKIAKLLNVDTLERLGWTQEQFAEYLDGIW